MVKTYVYTNSDELLAPLDKEAPASSGVLVAVLLYLLSVFCVFGTVWVLANTLNPETPKTQEYRAP